jgi:putative membrane protein
MNTITPKNNSGLRKWIIAISIVIPIAVAALFAIKIEGVDFSFLPPIYAGINAATAALLIMALRFIKQGNVQLHQKTIQMALVFTVLRSIPHDFRFYSLW